VLMGEILPAVLVSTEEKAPEMTGNPTVSRLREGLNPTHRRGQGAREKTQDR
jgi:hypothetical protein